MLFTTPAKHQTKPMVDKIVNGATHIPLPLHIVSEMNVREHWAVRMKRKSGHRKTAMFNCLGKLDLYRQLIHSGANCVTVTLHRIGKRIMDDDNLASGFKAVRDGVADALGVDDGDRKRVRWKYSQSTGKSYSIVICVASDNCQEHNLLAY